MKDSLGQPAFKQALAAVIVACALRLGINLDPASVIVLISPFLASIAALGARHLADGKTAQANAAVEVARLANVGAESARKPEGGFVASNVIGALAAIALVAALVGSATELGCSAAARHDTIVASVATIDGAEMALEAYIGPHELALIGSAASLEQGREAIATFRGNVAKTQEVIAAAYQAAVAAALANDGQTLAALVEAASALRSSLSAIGVTL